MSPHWGVRALLRVVVSRSGGGGVLRQTWRGCSSQRKGRVQGPQGDAQGVQDNEAGEQSENEGREGSDGAGGAWGHSSNRGRGRQGGTWSEVCKESLLCFAVNRQ